MEPKESFYRHQVVYWSCLRIAIISINFGSGQREREIFLHSQAICQLAGMDKEKKEVGTVQRYPDCNATAPFGIFDVPFFICFRFDSLYSYCSSLLPVSGNQQDFLLSRRIVSMSSFYGYRANN